MSEPNKQRLGLWADALESKQYAQGAAQLQIEDCTPIDDPAELKDPTKRYCCLGVAILVALDNGFVFTDDALALMGIIDVAAEDLPETGDEILSHLRGQGAGEDLWRPVAQWYGFGFVPSTNGNGEDSGVNPVIGVSEEGDPVKAIEANDDRNWTFPMIAKGIRKQYLEPSVFDKENRMRVIVTGSSNWEGVYAEGRVYRALDLLEALMELSEGALTIVHRGRPRGVDAIADTWARRRGIEPVIYETDWERYGITANTVSNGEMLNSGADLILAFVREEAAEPATSDLILAARNEGITTVVTKWVDV